MTIFRMRYLVTFVFLILHVSMVNSGNFTVFPLLSSSFSTTVTPTPSHTPTPTPTPTHSDCFQVNDTNGKACLKMLIYTMNITTFNTTTKKLSTATALPLNVSSGILVYGSCPMTLPGGDFNVSSLVLKWSDNKVNYSLSFSFRFNLKAKKGINSDLNEWYLSAVNYTNGTYSYSIDTSKNATIDATSGKSYFCANELSLNMTPATPTTSATKDTFAILYFSNYTVQAFDLGKTKYNFGDTINCVAAALPSYIPIIVGCSLAGLVLLVLVVYVIGRCYKGKQQEEGYERLS